MHKAPILKNQEERPYGLCCDLEW